MMQNGGGSMWFGGGFMWIFWVIIIIAIVWAVKSMTKTSSTQSDDLKDTDSPLEILNKRYAQGEIDKEEFENKKKDLK